VAQLRDSVTPLLHDWEAARNIDNEDDVFFDSSDGLSDSDTEDIPPTPDEQFMDKLLSLYLVNKLSSRDACELAFWASEGGIGEASRYGLAPGDPSDGHYSRKLKRAMGFTDRHDLLPVEVPGHVKRLQGRTKHDIVIMPLHEQIASDLKANESCRFRLDEMLRDKELPPVYYEHPLVTSCTTDEAILPIGLYLDGVPWSQSDGVLGFWGINLVSGRRYLWGVLKKSKVCQCGCRGWCSLYHYFEVARWSLESLFSGQYPIKRYDNKEFPMNDPFRVGLSGKPMGIRAACIYVKGDWAEYSTTLGFMSHMSGIRPCFG